MTGTACPTLRSLRVSHYRGIHCTLSVILAMTSFKVYDQADKYQIRFYSYLLFIRKNGQSHLAWSWQSLNDRKVCPRLQIQRYQLLRYLLRYRLRRPRIKNEAGLSLVVTVSSSSPRSKTHGTTMITTRTLTIPARTRSWTLMKLEKKISKNFLPILA